jgi:hypothetical protein
MSLYNWGYLCLMISLLLIVLSTTISGNWLLAMSLIGGLFAVLSGGLFGLAGSRNIRK